MNVKPSVLYNIVRPDEKSRGRKKHLPTILIALKNLKENESLRRGIEVKTVMVDYNDVKNMIDENMNLILTQLQQIKELLKPE